jgi:hypothetical protein
MRLNYTIETPEGPKPKSIYGRMYKEVEKKLAEARGDAARGLIFDADNLKLGEYLDRWLADSVADTVRPTTFERYEQIVRVHIRPPLSNLELKNVTPAHVRGLYREKLEDELSPRTVQYIHVTLHKALKQDVDDGLIPRNATEAVRPPQVRKEEIPPFDHRAGENVVRGRAGRQARIPLHPCRSHRAAAGRVARPQVGRRRP